MDEGDLGAYVPGEGVPIDIGVWTLNTGTWVGDGKRGARQNTGGKIRAVTQTPALESWRMALHTYIAYARASH